MIRFAAATCCLVGLAVPPAWADTGHGDSCFGDRYESDADLNEGNEISDREMRELLEQINGPGV